MSNYNQTRVHLKNCVIRLQCPGSLVYIFEHIYSFYADDYTYNLYVVMGGIGGKLSVMHRKKLS